MRRRTVHAAFAIAASVCGAMAIRDGLQLREAERINVAITTAHISASDARMPQEVRLAALYNLGNLNMREALKQGQGEAQRFIPLIELAKQSYRDDLRGNPGDWDARYNLERALWLSPEYDDPMLQRSQTPVRSEHAMSTMQGAKIDLP
jgi:mxaK protein